MAKRRPVIWSFRNEAHTGALELAGDRVILRGAERVLSFPLAGVAHSTVERGAAMRIRGLPVIRVTTDGGIVVRIASLGGAGTLHDLAAELAVHPLGSVT